MSLDISRHKELFNPENFDIPINIIGVGATGSWLALSLAKLGITDIAVWDYDKIEEHNIANQAFLPHQIGQFKVDALADLILQATGSTIYKVNDKVVHQRMSGIVFLMVDSMEGRKQIWQNCIKLKSAVKHLIEPRMGLDMGRIYNIDPVNMRHIEEYENTYYTDEEAELSACGNSMSVISSAMAVTSWCTRQLINYVNGEDMDNEILIDFKYNNIISTRW